MTVPEAYTPEEKAARASKIQSAYARKENAERALRGYAEALRTRRRAGDPTAYGQLERKTLQNLAHDLNRASLRVDRVPSEGRQ